jgi:AraC family transcriptional regulator
MLPPPHSDLAKPSVVALPAAIAGLIKSAVASFDGDRAASRDYLFRAFDLLRMHEQRIASAGCRSTRAGLASWQAKVVVAYIETNLANAIRAQDLAELTNLSTSHFFRAFKGVIGVPPIQYINQRRIQCALEMMRNTHEHLSRIGAACGLSDQSHFCRVFRRIVGQSPNEWRRENSNGPATDRRRLVSRDRQPTAGMRVLPGPSPTPSPGDRYASASKTGMT